MVWPFDEPTKIEPKPEVVTQMKYTVLGSGKVQVIDADAHEYSGAGLTLFLNKQVVAIFHVWDSFTIHRPE